MAIGTAVSDFKRELPKVLLEIISKRAPPRMWSKYITASTAIRLFNNSDTRLGDEMRSAA